MGPPPRSWDPWARLTMGPIPEDLEIDSPSWNQERARQLDSEDRGAGRDRACRRPELVRAAASVPGCRDGAGYRARGHEGARRVVRYAGAGPDLPRPGTGEGPARGARRPCSVPWRADRLRPRFGRGVSRRGPSTRPGGIVLRRFRDRPESARGQPIPNHTKNIERGESKEDYSTCAGYLPCCSIERSHRPDQAIQGLLPVP